VLSWLARRDPGWYGLRRAVRAAAVVTLSFAIGSQLFHNAQLATFAAFGSFAILLLANINGDRTARTFGYLALALAGAALVTIGTLAQRPSWLAVLTMAVVAFVVVFAGVISSMISGAGQAALLAFILAVLLPAARSDLPARLAGWAIAVAVSVPVALFVWPPRDEDALRQRAAQLCRALAGLVDLKQPPPGAGDSLVAMRAAARELRDTFRGSSARTAGLSTGARLLIRLVDQLEWLAATAVNACADAPEQWSGEGRRLRAAATRVLTECGAVLDSPTSEQVQAELRESLTQLADTRGAVARETLDELQIRTQPLDGGSVRGEFGRPLYAAHELGYVVAMAGHTVATIAAADSRSWWQRLIGRRVREDELGVVTVAQRAALGQLDRHGVWLQNSIRSAAGLAAAVLIARLVDAQNAFWVGLGALSVLRSTALSTGSTAARAIAGTVGGFAIGGALVAALGTSHAVLWPLLPVAVFIAAYAPAALSFVAGQAAFTVLVIILFNIIAPAGWRIGVIRVEDVALGCAASLLAGTLFWPRGAGSALGAALGDAYAAAAAYLRQSIEAVTGHRPIAPDARANAIAAGERLDSALRQYLAERGTKRVSLEKVATLAGGAARLRLAGTAITNLQYEAPERRLVQAGDRTLEAPADVLFRRGSDVAGWYVTLADAFSTPGSPLPANGDGQAGESFLEVVLPAVDGCGDADRAARAERLLWAGQYLGDVDQLRADLLEPAAKIASAGATPWWHR
jgi:hypothetical protein